MVAVSGPPRVRQIPGSVSRSSGVVNPYSGRTADLDLELHLALDPVDDAMQRRRGVQADVVVHVVRMERHEVGQGDDAARGAKLGAKDHRVIEIHARGFGRAGG